MGNRQRRDDPPDVRLSRLLSYVLRHAPDAFGLRLDAAGFVPLDDLIAALQARGRRVTAADIERLLDSPEERENKIRYTLTDGKIRANYGHSVAVRIQHERAEPPEHLLHGTHESALAEILRQGLRPMRRQYVHLVSADRPDIATEVGARRGPSVLLEVEAAAAHRAGIAFYRANPVFWLTHHVPAYFMRRKEA